ncbi:MAG: AbrB/MazE/SpoVT family DNA-binding domain-containing protein [Syntrophomonadaceae bacterium]|nr:AbrB/MazE/SpoVT family DNA-binding domain-containing protein [Syntrophomonadaceae bacterium]
MKFAKKLGLKEGDKVIFMEKSGDIVLMNSNRLVFEEFQRDMAGEAVRAGLNSEDDVADLVKQICGKMWEAQHAGNA